MSEIEKLAQMCGSLLERVRSLEWERSVWNDRMGRLRHEPDNDVPASGGRALCGARGVTLCYPPKNANANCPLCLALRGK